MLGADYYFWTLYIYTLIINTHTILAPSSHSIVRVWTSVTWAFMPLYNDFEQDLHVAQMKIKFGAYPSPTSPDIFVDMMM